MSDTPLEAPQPTLRLRIDHHALASNWRALDQMSGHAEAGAAVKAQCYGLGVDQCVPALRDAGARQFFVAHWGEVAAVSAHVPASSIAVLHGPMTAQDAAYARSVGAIPVINSLHQAQVWHDGGGGPCDLMVDTGINRLGIAPQQLSEALIQSLDVRVLMSHLACADEDSAMNQRQLAAFHDASVKVKHQTLSLANSAGIGLGPDYAFDLTRPGLSLYGGVPRSELSQHIQQVAFPQAAIIQTRQIDAGESVGYNAAFTAEKPMRVGVVSLGYADGYLRCWNGAGALMHDDRRLRLLGKVSMDMIVIDLSNAPELGEGDWLEVPYLLHDAAQQSTLSQYELLTILGTRLKGA